ncbi:MAG: hypothetical protein KJ799_01905, partial [Bacteroidetes bacterium]|nr:hypothetical protein [Bacteroidota bacterium]
MIRLKILLICFVFVTISFSQTNYQWHHLNGPLGGIVGDIAIDSKDNIYAGVYTNFFYYYTGIFKSSDNGNTWTDLKTDYDEIQVYSIFINENDSVYLGTSGTGLHLSDDYGESWKRIDTGYNTREWFAIGQNQYGDFFAGDAQYQEMYKSYNHGYNWEFVG